MRLTECNADFIDAKDRRGIGLMFDCPLCVRAGLQSFRFRTPGISAKDVLGRTLPWARLLPVHFKNPLDGGPPVTENARRPLWDRTGDTLETLTLSPSLDASVHGTDWHLEALDGDASGRRHLGWHGHIQNGLMVGGGA